VAPLHTPPRSLVGAPTYQEGSAPHAGLFPAAVYLYVSKFNPIFDVFFFFTFVLSCVSSVLPLNVFFVVIVGITVVLDFANRKLNKLIILCCL
jgi:hypothetical protein